MFHVKHFTYQNLMQMTSIRGRRYYSHYMRYLQLIAFQMFKWENLPKGIDERFLEVTLHVQGQICFVKHPKMGFIVAQGSPYGHFDIYGRPTKFRCVFPNYQNFNSVLYNFVGDNKNANGVMIYNNDTQMPTYPSLQLFADDLAHIKQVTKINVNGQKTPHIIVGNDKILMSLKKYEKQMELDAETIHINDKLDLNALQVYQTPAPYVADKLNEHLSFTWNEAMTFLGITNTNQLKRERMITDEVNANNEQTQASENIYLKARQQACDIINDLFGLDVKVSIRTETFEKAQQIEEEFRRGLT